MTHSKPEGEAMSRLKVKDAAEYVGLGESTLNMYRVQGGGPVYIKTGAGKTSRVLYDTKDLDEWLEARKRRSTSDHSPPSAV